MAGGFSLPDYREAILRIAARYGARNARVFGSMARADARPDSDIDLLVDLEPGRTLLDHVGLWRELEEPLGQGVDSAVEGGIDPYLDQRIRA